MSLRKRNYILVEAGSEAVDVTTVYHLEMKTPAMKKFKQMFNNYRTIGRFSFSNDDMLGEVIIGQDDKETIYGSKRKKDNPDKVAVVSVGKFPYNSSETKVYVFGKNDKFKDVRDILSRLNLKIRYMK